MIVGAPPFARGSDEPGQDLELQILKSFPRAALFIEKPVTSGPAEAAWRVAKELTRAKALVSVGYVLRYLKSPWLAFYTFVSLIYSYIYSCAKDEVRVFRERRAQILNFWPPGK